MVSHTGFAAFKRTINFCLKQAVLLTKSFYTPNTKSPVGCSISESATNVQSCGLISISDGMRSLSTVKCNDMKAPYLRTRLDHGQERNRCEARRRKAETVGLKDINGISDSHQKDVPRKSRPSCPICMGQPERDACSIPSCGHVYCRACIQEYLMRVATETKAYPIPCPECRLGMEAEFCLSLFPIGTRFYECLEDLIVERVYYDRIRYCSNPSCATPFDWVQDTRTRSCPEEFKITCVFCKTPTCVNCKEGWHDNKTCDTVLSEKKNETFFRLALQNEWQGCPTCGHVIERHSGYCNFVRCRCGCGFCHKCGVEYRPAVIGDRSRHGQPRCHCVMFG